MKYTNLVVRAPEELSSCITKKLVDLYNCVVSMIHDCKMARIAVEGHCAHRRMICFLLLSLGVEEADRWVLASTTWFLSVSIWMARYTAQRNEMLGVPLYYPELGAQLVYWNQFA